MKSPPRPHRREPGVTRWLLLGGALCALVLMLCLASCLTNFTGHVSAAPRERGAARRVPASMTRRPAAPRLLEHPDAPPHAALELPRPEQPAPGGDKRFEARLGFTPGLVRGVPASGGVARVHGPGAPRGHRADRPLVANCPARGPPERRGSSSR